MTHAPQALTAAAPAISIDCRPRSGQGRLAVKCLSSHVWAAMEADRDQCPLWSGTIIAVRLAAGSRRGSFGPGDSRTAPAWMNCGTSTVVGDGSAVRGARGRANILKQRILQTFLPNPDRATALPAARLPAITGWGFLP